MLKKIWFINQYGSIPKTGIATRHRYFARELSAIGHKVSYISSRLTHKTIDKKAAISAPEYEKFEGFNFYRIPSIKYKNAHDKKRIMNWFYFAFKLLSIKKKINHKPNVIIYSSPSLIGFLSAYILAKKYGAKIIFDVRDIWPLTFIEIGSYSKNNLFIKFLQFIEDFAYKKSDYVISNLKGLESHIEMRIKKQKKFTWIPNGSVFDKNEKIEYADKKILSTIQSQPFSITYTGAIGQVNSLDVLIEAAILIKNRKNIHINIFGDGIYAKTLKNYSKQNNLNNIHFWGSVPKNEVQSILKVTDACIICWKNSKIYNYGVAANKLFDYLNSGKPIIHSYSGCYDIVSEYKTGITVPAENSLLLSKAICKLSSMSKEELAKMGERGRKVSIDYFNYSKISLKLNKIICSL